MIEVTLITNGLDLSKRLSTYSTSMSKPYTKVITTMDNRDHPFPALSKANVTFSLIPQTDEESAEVYEALSDMIIPVRFTNMTTGAEAEKNMRITSDLESAFLLLSVDGKRRYMGGNIKMSEL